MKIDYKQILKKYFRAFSNKDVETLSNLFNDDIHLIDWNVESMGKDNVLDTNQSIFNSVETIKVFVNSIYENQKDKSFLCLIDIVINNDELIKVSDYIKFDNDGRIKSIEACLLNSHQF